MSELTSLYNPFFSHIYVEKDAYRYEMTQDILKKFSGSKIIDIVHYKDVFNRNHQNFTEQKKSPSLILAVKKNQRIYQGAKVCQSFGNAHFYYASLMMNCPFDCEYCYLQGMYPSANMVVFVNQEDFFEDVRELLHLHPVYLCISYDTDLLAMEPVTGLVKKWTEFAMEEPNLTIEVRTKSSARKLFDNIPFCGRIIYAWTLSPKEISERYEHGAGALEKRLLSAAYAQEKGHQVRVCFDPMIYCKGYKEKYAELFHETFTSLDSSKIFDCSLGVFRISSEYLKQMRRQRNCLVTQFPYVTHKGVCSYGEKRNEEMLAFAKEQIVKWLPEEKIFTWQEGDNE